MSATTLPNPRRPTPHRAAPPRAPRRISGPVTGRVSPRPAPQQAPTVGARALAVVCSLPDHSLIDRLVRGRAWIPVLGVLLAGIVAMQVEILKLGTSLGGSLERTASLQSQNETLQAGVASLDNSQRIESIAAGMGMVTPSPGLLRFASSQAQGQLGRAIANIHAPDPAGFALQLASQIAAADLAAPSTSSVASATSAAGGQSAGATGSATSTVSPAGAQGATTAVGTNSTGAGTSGTGPVIGGTATGTAGTTGSAGTPATAGGSAGSTPATGAVSTTSPATAPAGGTGASAGGAGLPTTSQSGSSSGG